MSRHVNLKDQTFTWDHVGLITTEHNSIIYYFRNFRPTELFRVANLISLPAIISSGWDKQDFLDAIECWKAIGLYTREKEMFAIKDWEENLDKYLNEATIKSIIE